MNTIPVVDLSQYTEGSEADKNKFVHALGSAYEEVGFVAVVNHGIPQTLIKKLYEQVEAFFSLTENQKKQYEKIELAGQRGYTSFGREHAKGFDAPDLKEFFQWGQFHAHGQVYADNVEVAEWPQLIAEVREAFELLEYTGRQLLKAIALYLGLDENWFEPYVLGGNSILRALHYPPITQAPNDAVRAAAHEDINLITLLMGASADGLELLSASGDWIPVHVEDSHLVINVGDMLQRLTNNNLRSTTHRVVNPPVAKWGIPRFSIPFFLHPIQSMPLDALSACVTKENPLAYAPTTAGEYLDERLREIGLKT
jgi:isopenicillin N synthase-like dioxygenase